jgi:hypothetical protein
MSNYETNLSSLYALLTTDESLFVRQFHITLDAALANVPDTQVKLKEAFTAAILLKVAQLMRYDGIKIPLLSAFDNLTPEQEKRSTLRGVFSATQTPVGLEFSSKLATFIADNVESTAKATYLLILYSYQPAKK